MWTKIEIWNKSDLKETREGEDELDWNRETGQMACLPKQWSMDEATDLTEKGQFTHWNHTSLPVHLLTMFLSSQQVPIDVYQIWRTVVGETERHSQDRKLGEKSKLSQPLLRPFGVLVTVSWRSPDSQT